MLPYYFLIAIPIIYAFYYELVYEKSGRIIQKKNNTIIVFFVLCSILVAFRSKNIGADTSRYLEIYETTRDVSWNEFFRIFEGGEYGYFLVNRIIGMVFYNEQFMLIVTALMSVLPIAYLYHKETKNCLVSMALFITMPVFPMMFSGIRQSIAIAFVLPALYFTKRRELFKFLLTVFCATLFHKSAFIIIVLYPIYYMNIKFKNAFLLVPIGFVILRFNTQLYLLLAGLMGSEFEERYAYVTETGAYTMLVVYVLFTVYAFFVMDESKIDENTRALRNYLVVATFLQMFAPVNIIAMRLNYYFIVFIPIVITHINHYSKIKDKRIRFIINAAIFMLFTAYYIDKANSMDSFNIYPYEFFFQ